MRTGIGKLTLLSMQLLTVMMTLMLWTIPTTLHAQEEGDNISREIFIYSPNERAGLHAAYLDIEQRWIEIGQLCASDYGQWGAEKRMYSPCVLRASDGTWRAIWQVNDYSPCFAATYSKDLIVWRPQDYPRLSTKNCLKPIMFEGDDQTFDIFYISGNEKYYLQGDKDFRHFTQPQESSISDVAWGGDTATVDGRLYEGKIFDITQGELIQLLTEVRFTRAIYTEPVNSLRKEPYLNQLCEGSTALGSELLSEVLKEHEKRQGRTHNEDGIVTLDLDLMQYDDVRYHLRDWERNYIKDLINEL